MLDREAALFASVSPVLTLVSPLADGTDQMAASAGLARGWRLQTVPPFDRATYVRDFTEPAAATARFTSLLERSDLVNQQQELSVS